MGVIRGMDTDVPQCLDDRRQERRQHIVVIGRTTDFLHLIRDLLRERYTITTTDSVPNTFAQIAAFDLDVLIMDIAVGEQER